MLFAFVSTTLLPGPVFAQVAFQLPQPGAMVRLSPSFKPALLVGVILNPQHPFRFNFIVNSGDSNLKGEELKKESERMIKYFLASLTTPENDLWVNLSPYEKDRIIPNELGQTEMGRDLLAQDYILKQLTASLVYPEDNLGKEFWDKVYRKARELYGATEIPVNTFNKVWIVPDKAVVYEHNETALVIESHLKVMLEEDYLALKNNLTNHDIGTDQMNAQDTKQLNQVSSQVVKEVLLPELEREINGGKNFAGLRQIYHAMILATWYKKAFKESILGKLYMDQKKIKGVDVEDKEIQKKIYNHYLKAFKQGVYDYIREDHDQITGKTVARRYFSGGFEGERLKETQQTVTAETISPRQQVEAAGLVQGDNTDITVLETAFTDVAMLSKAPSAAIIPDNGPARVQTELEEIRELITNQEWQKAASKMLALVNTLDGLSRNETGEESNALKNRIIDLKNRLEAFEASEASKASKASEASEASGGPALKSLKNPEMTFQDMGTELIALSILWYGPDFVPGVTPEERNRLLRSISNGGGPAVTPEERAALLQGLLLIPQGESDLGMAQMEQQLNEIKTKVEASQWAEAVALLSTLPPELEDAISRMPQSKDGNDERRFLLDILKEVHQIQGEIFQVTFLDFSVMEKYDSKRANYLRVQANILDILKRVSLIIRKLKTFQAAGFNNDNPLKEIDGQFASAEQHIKDKRWQDAFNILDGLTGTLQKQSGIISNSKFQEKINNLQVDFLRMSLGEMTDQKNEKLQEKVRELSVAIEEVRTIWAGGKKTTLAGKPIGTGTPDSQNNDAQSLSGNLLVEEPLPARLSKLGPEKIKELSEIKKEFISQYQNAQRSIETGDLDDVIDTLFTILLDRLESMAKIMGKNELASKIGLYRSNAVETVNKAWASHNNQDKEKIIVGLVEQLKTFLEQYDDPELLDLFTLDEQNKKRVRELNSLIHDLRNILTAPSGAIELFKKGLEKNSDAYTLWDGRQQEIQKLVERINFIIFQTKINLFTKQLPDITTSLAEEIEAMFELLKTYRAEIAAAEIATKKNHSYFFNGIVKADPLIKELKSLFNADQSEQFIKEPVDLVPVLKSAFQAARTEEADAEITFDGGLTITSDSGALYRIFFNIFANALRAMKGSSSKKFNVSIRMENDRVVIRIADTAGGIPEEIFAKFLNEEQTTNKDTGGTGTGLIGVRDIIRKNGGRLSVVSERGKGAMFTIELPLNRETALPSEQSIPRTRVQMPVVQKTDGKAGRTGTVFVFGKATVGEVLRAVAAYDQSYGEPQSFSFNEKDEPIWDGQGVVVTSNNKELAGPNWRETDADNKEIVLAVPQAAEAPKAVTAVAGATEMKGNVTTQQDAALLRKTPGGIDLNPVNLDLIIKRDGQGMPLPVELQDIQNIRIEGLYPVILKMSPASAVNLPKLLGLNENIPEKSNEMAAAKLY